MKKVLQGVISLIFCAIPSCAQDGNGQLGERCDFLRERLVFDFQASLSTMSNTHLTYSVDFGVNLNQRLYGFASYSNYWMLSKENGNRLYHATNLLGGGLGYRCFGKLQRRMSMDIRAKVEQSIVNNSMTATVYDAGINFRLGGPLLVPTIGLGFRHAHMHTSGLSHQNYVYLSLGVGL